MCTTASQIDQNIDQVKIKGGELETQWHPISNWTLFGNFGYTDSRITQLAAYPQYVGNYTPYLDALECGTGHRVPRTTRGRAEVVRSG